MCLTLYVLCLFFCRHALVDESKSRITRLTIHRGWLYWVDRDLNQLQRLELLSGKSRSALPVQASNITDLISVTKPGGDNPCAARPQNCSHFCILNGTSPVCACLKGKVLQEDKRTCVISPSCGPDHFTCVFASHDTKDCIPLLWRCDGQRDCSDGMDEMDCLPCRSDQFKCQNGQCLDQSLVCDGTPQCQDKSDEANCCKNSFQCPHTDACVPIGQVCDGIEHCADGADEHPSLCNSTNIKKKPHHSEIIIFTGIVVLLIWVSLTIVYVHKRMSKREVVQEQTEDLLTPTQTNPQVKGPATTRKGIPDLVRMSMLTGQSSSYDRGNITGASSSSNGSSGICYPCETLNPPPSPATTRGSSSCSHYRPYRHYRSINQPPPPTPCSTDVCDESDYNYSLYPARSRYDPGPFPPPPTPRSHCHSESCPPSPSSRASTYFSPLPPPPSPVPSPPRGYSS